jgi:hypothetical protein
MFGVYMDKKQQSDKSFSVWFSTYGSLTAEGVLEQFHIQLPHDVLIASLNAPGNPYYDVLEVPMINIFNGIIFQQAYDYNVYAQKLLIDYRLSPEFAKDAEAPGASIREDLVGLYDQLLALGKAFTEHQLAHYRLISESQGWLIKHIGALNNPKDELATLTEDESFKEVMEQYSAQANEMTINFKGYRNQFYDLILSLTERLTMLPDYHFDEEHAAKEREALLFDPLIGGE